MLFAPAHGCQALLITSVCLFAWPAWGQLASKQAAADTPAASDTADDQTEEGLAEEGLAEEGQADPLAEHDCPCPETIGGNFESLSPLSPLSADSPARRFYQALVRRLPDYTSPRVGRGGGTRSKPGCVAACPLCGQSWHDDDGAAIASDLPKSGLERSTFRAVSGRRPAADNADEAEVLQSGEPAEVILEMRKRLGPSLFEGTDFSGSPDLLVKWIRALDAENRRRQAEEDPAEGDDGSPAHATTDVHEQVKALREASRQLQAAADLLEDQNLFESSDHIRELADHLRQQSREQVGE